MQDSQIRFFPLAVKTVVCHSVTYFLMGILAYNFLNYQAVIDQPCSGMRPVTSMWVMMGPMLQIFRGLLFASVFYLFRERLFAHKHGWARMAWVLIGIGILGTFAAPAGSLEGFIYTTTPIRFQIRGYLEVVPQALLTSALLYFWVNRPGKKWITWSLSAAYVAIVLLPLLGVLAQHMQKR